MGIVTNNDLMEGVSGQVGNVVFRQRNGTVVVASPPTKRSTVRETQKPAIRAFTKGNRWARIITEDPVIKARYARLIQKKSYPTAHHVALGDYFSVPEVIYIDPKKYSGEVGDVIMVKVVEKFLVHHVHVQLIDRDGQVIEAGDAIPYKGKKNLWNYFATTCQQLPEITIRAVAFDLADNQGALEYTFGPTL